MKVSDFVGKEVVHEYYGKVFVNDAPKRSKATVNVTVLQRSKGWDDKKEQYKRYFVGASLQVDGNRSLRWAISRHDYYGTKESVHINTLKLTS